MHILFKKIFLSNVMSASSYANVPLGAFGFGMSALNGIDNLQVHYWLGVALLILAIAKGLMDLRTKYLNQEKTIAETHKLNKGDQGYQENQAHPKPENES